MLSSYYLSTIFSIYLIEWTKLACFWNQPRDGSVLAGDRPDNTLALDGGYVTADGTGGSQRVGNGSAMFRGL